MSSHLRKKIVSIAISATIVVWLSGFTAFVPVAKAVTIDELLQQITLLQQQLAALQGGQSGSSSCTPPSVNLTPGTTNAAVKALQMCLNAMGYTVASSGAGSPGNESSYFGSRTRAAVAAFQVAKGIAAGAYSGYFGPSTRAAMQAAAGGGTTGGGTTPPPPPSGAAGTLMVSLASNQPPAGLFGESFASRPFTNLVFTAGASDVTVSSLGVQRTGQSQDAAFNGVVALDEQGIRLGDSKTFGSNHTLTLTNSFVVHAGQSRTITLAGDSDSDQDAYNGQLVSLTLISVGAGSNVTVSGIPSTGLTGTTHTVNSTLAIGSVTVERGPLDPGTDVTKEAGTTGYKFSSLKLNAGSNEDVSLKAFSWNQSGSAGASDLANVKIVVNNSQSFDATVSSDGKYFIAIFPGGITIPKGSSAEVTIMGDVVSGSNRTVDMDLYRAADIRVGGLVYGYDILPTYTNSSGSPVGTDHNGTFQSSNPNYDGYRLTIGAGTITVESATADVPSQNIAINLSDQPLGGFKITVRGEPISAAQTIFWFNRGVGSGATTGSTQDLTNVKLVRMSDNTVVAGPVDISSTQATPKVTFTDTITYPVGIGMVYKLIGKLGTDFATNDTVQASTTPNTDWSTVKGVNTNQTVTLSSAVVTGGTMTVKAGALAIATLPNPVVQTAVAGVQGFNFANFSLDTTASGEDVRLNSVAVQFNFGQANSNDDLTSCRLWDGATALNTGSNVVNGANADVTADKLTFTFDQSLTMPKGTVKTLALKCNTTATTSTAASTYNWTIGIAGAASDMIPTGVVSGSTITETYTDVTGQAITLTGGGTVQVALDIVSSPSLALAPANTTNVPISAYRLTGTAEPIKLTQIGLFMASAASTTHASSTVQDISKVTIWNGSTKVGESIFSTVTATTTLSNGAYPDVIIPQDSDLVLTLKVDTAMIGNSQAGKPGHLVRVEIDPNAADATGKTTRGVGVSSGTTIYSTGSPADSAGFRLVKNVPILSPIALPSTKLINAPMSLYRFSVTAPSTGGVGLYKFTYSISTSTQGATSYAITSLQVRGYSDSAFSQPAYANGGLLNSGAVGDSGGVTNDGSALYSVRFDATTAGTVEALQIPAGSTRYFELIGTVANTSATSSSASINLQGDSSWLAGTNNNSATTSISTFDNFSGSGAGLYAFATTAANVDADATHDDFIWSDNATTTSGVGTYDFFNGFQIPGLPPTNTTNVVLTP